MRKTPKVFISYSCTNEKRAIDIACRLIKNGVEVVVDKWDLKPGHDKFQFMERSVTDPTIDKVLLLCDRTYKEKADSRAGGVGDETTIISSKIYGEATQEKFLAVALEFDENGAPFLPAYMSSRIYIDFGDKKGSGKQFEDLLRAIYDRPKHSRPATGSEPDFLDQDEDCVSGESGYKTPTLLNNKSLQQNCVNKFHYHKDNSDAVKKLASLLQLLHPKVPHYPPALFTCFFFDALTNWEYHYNDDIFKSGYDTGNIDFQNLMENIYNGESELPAYLRAHIENSLQKTEMDSISEFIAFCCGDIDCCAVNNLTGNATGDSIADKVVQYIHIICASYHQPEQPVSNFPKGIPYASLTYEPWIQFSENTNRTSPDTQSRFNYLVRAAALCGRFDELNCLIEFCNSDVAGEPFLWFAVSGLGGSGKSRIAKELYEWIEYINSGQWKLFWIDIANAAEVDIDEKMDKVIAATKPNQQVLVVLDSNKHYLRRLGNKIKKLYARSLETKSKVRVLLVERSQVDINELYWGTRNIVDNKFVPRVFHHSAYLDNEGLMALDTLDDTVLFDIINSYSKGTGQGNLKQETIWKILLDIDCALKLPLYIEYIADAALKESSIHGQIDIWNKSKVMRYAINGDMDSILAACKSLVGLASHKQEGFSEKQEKLFSICKDTLLLTSLLPVVRWDAFTEIFPSLYKRLQHYAAIQELDDPRELLSECLGYTIDNDIVSIWPDMVCEYNAVQYMSNPNIPNRDKEKAISSAAIINFDALWDRADRIRSDYWDLLEKAGSLDFFQWKYLIDKYNGKPFRTFGGHQWDRIDKPNECEDMPALIITRDIAFQSVYDSSGQGFNWEKSSLRKFLNGSWYEMISKALEQECPELQIKRTLTQNGRGTGQGQYANSYTVRDNIFIISEEEARQYYGLPENWITHQRVQNKKMIAVNKKYPCRWWLRSSGDGYAVTREGVIENESDSIDDEEFGVRPALWVSQTEELGVRRVLWVPQTKEGE